MTPLDRAEAELLIQSRDPLNAEPHPDALIDTFLTPQSRFYVRCHGDIPDLPPDHRVVVGGRVAHPLSLTPADLRARFPERTVTAVLQCAGNRRAHLQPVAKTSGDPWGIGAIGNARWTGVSLADVLTAAGAAGDAGHVGFTAADIVTVEGETAAFGVSIARERAMAGDVLLAWALNGEPLAPEHGAPLRLIVPGYAGVRSIKWLTAIEVRDTPSAAAIQARDYKLFPADVTKATADWDAGLTIEAMPVNAAICTPADGAAVAAGSVAVRGYAVAYGRAIARVELSVDGGANWIQAAIERDASAPAAWVRWDAMPVLPPGAHDLIVRAVDDAGQQQPEHAADVWNFAGYLSTAWHRIRLIVR